MAVQKPETILIVAANPIDQPRLRLDKEVREIRNGLRSSRKRFALEQLWAATSDDLRRALLDHEPTYVHFSGHGTGAHGIALEGSLASGPALAGLFAEFADHVKCVVLNACYSAAQAHEIVKHVDYVIGMSKAVQDRAAIAFSTAFYDGVGAGKSVETAFALGCNAIQFAGTPEHLVPQLLTRSAPARPGGVATRVPRRPMAHTDWDGAPAVPQLFGRDQEADMLRSWIVNDSCRVVLITGMGGVGKTDLVTCLGRGGNRIEGASGVLTEGIHDRFESVMWRSLLNAPPPEELFGDMVEFLSEHRRSAGNSPDQQIEDILGCFQDRHCLVILDNVEAVLSPGDPQMRYRQGYEAYGAFFEQVARSTHRSCLLLTSREKPRAIADLEGMRKPVRSLSLTGLGTAEGRSLFQQIGDFSGVETDWTRVVRLYDGNPLALELAARHIDQVFSGDLGAFLGIGRPVFDGLEELLDWHLDRLSPLETELVYWLAIEREPVNVQVLSDDFVSTVSRGHTTSTLQSLQRRIPLERSGSGRFTLQPVLIEHVTARLVDEVVGGFATAFADVRGRGGTAGVALDDLRAFDTYALVKATVKEHVRESQRRLILGPVAERLQAMYGAEVRRMAVALLDALRLDRPGEPGYAAGNLVNLLAHLDVNVGGMNFSHLPVRQACLHEVNLHNTDFSFCGFRDTTFKYPFGTVFALGYSPDGTSIAVGDDNGEVRVFRAADGTFAMQCVGHSDVVWAVAYSPDGHTMASASFDNTIRIWSTRDGRCVNVLMGHRGWIYSLAFSPDGSTLMSAGEDGTCRLWNVRTGTWTSPAVQEEGFLASAAFSTDGRLLAVGGSGRAVYVFQVTDLQAPLFVLPHEARVRAVAFSPAGDVLASGGEDDRVYFWSTADGAPLGARPGHGGGITSLSFSSAGDVLASASVDQTVRLWDTARRECVGQIRVGPARVWAVQCSPTDRTLTTGSEDGAVRVWNMDTCECLTTLRGYSNKAWSLAFSPHRPLLLAAYEDRLVRTWNIEDARAEMELSGHLSRVWAVACSPDGQWAASASDDLSVRLWDLRSGACRHVLHGHTDWIRAVAFDPAGRLLASAGEDGRVMVWDVASGNRVTQMEGDMARVLGVAFCRDGHCLAAGGAGDTIHLYSPLDGSHMGKLAGHTGWISALVPRDAAGLVLASCSEDGTVMFWDLERMACTGMLTVGSRVWCGAYCVEGRSFLSGSDDGILRRWHLDNGQCVSEALAHQGAVWSLAVNAAGDTVATAGNDGSVRLWGLPSLTGYPAGTLRPARPYEDMNITGATGLAPAQREALLALGAISFPLFP
jgi:WD40 repeat protein